MVVGDAADSMPQDDIGADPIVKALERSTVAQALRAARASLAKPSRPLTPLDRSLFQQVDVGDASRPSSAYSVDHLSLLRECHGGAPYGLAVRGDNRGGSVVLP